MKCILPICPRDKSVSLHRFPTKPATRERWMRSINTALGGELLKMVKNIKNMVICGKHFRPECFSLFGSRTKLKKLSIPTVYCDLDGNKFEVELSEEENDIPSPKKRDGPRSKKQDSTNPRNQDSPSPRKQDCPNPRKRDIPSFRKPDIASTGKQLRPLTRKQDIPSTRTQDISSPSKPVIPYRRKRASLFKSQPQQTKDSILMPPAMPLPSNFRDVCRLCFTASEDLVPLYSGLIVVRDEMLDRIYLCTGILIVPKPKESASICKHCEQTIKTFFSFRQQVSSNNLSYLEQKATDETIAKQSISFINMRKRKLTKLLTKVPAKIKPKTDVPEPLRVEFIKKKTVPKPAPELVPNPLDYESQIKPDPEDRPDVCAIEDDPIQTIDWNVETIREIPSSENQSAGQQLREQESWTCQSCDRTFLCKFECAKHLLLTHKQRVEFIKRQLNLDELNTNMLRNCEG